MNRAAVSAGTIATLVMLLLLLATASGLALIMRRALLATGSAGAEAQRSRGRRLLLNLWWIAPLALVVLAVLAVVLIRVGGGA